MVEYALLLCLIAVGMVSVFKTLTGHIAGTFQFIIDAGFQRVPGIK